MEVTRELLLSKLPEYRDEWLVIKDKQEVKDIIREMLDAYPGFAPFYDNICQYFIGSDINQTCENLFYFCKKYIDYSEESEHEQISSLPTGILHRGYGDCKAYASFIGGCLGAIERATGKPIDWKYSFASYLLTEKTPYHVFVTVDTPAGPIWVDPTPGSEEKIPVWLYEYRPDEPVEGMVVSGMGDLMPAAVGSVAPGTNIPAGTLPLPDGYPAGLPRPHIVNGRLQFDGVPPNFRPDAMQLGYMMLALQLWIFTYSDHPYDVFSYNSRTDGSGDSIAGIIDMFCRYYKNPDWYYKGFYYYTGYLNHWLHFGLSSVTDYDRHQNSIWMPVLEKIANYDFLNPVPVEKPDLLGQLGMSVMTILSKVLSVIPGVGQLFAIAWNKVLQHRGLSSSIQIAAATAGGGIVTQQQETERKERLIKIAFFAALLLALWWYYNDDE